MMKSREWREHDYFLACTCGVWKTGTKVLLHVQRVCGSQRSVRILQFALVPTESREYYLKPKGRREKKAT
jgi:hypothetical protein